MRTLSISLPLPKEIKKHLERLCFGLPTAQWTESDCLYITLLPLGPADGNSQKDIQEKLGELKFSPFNLNLQSIECLNSKNGFLLVNVNPHEEILKLKKAIETSLQEIPAPPPRKPFTPHLTLARYDQVDPKRFGDYLEANAYFTTPSFLVDTLVLVETRLTAKERTICTEIARYPKKEEKSTPGWHIPASS